MVVTALIYGHPRWVLIDSDATKCFVSLAAILPLGLQIIKYYILLELGDGQKILSKGKVFNVPVVTTNVTF